MLDWLDGAYSSRETTEDEREAVSGHGGFDAVPEHQEMMRPLRFAQPHYHHLVVHTPYDAVARFIAYNNSLYPVCIVRGLTIAAVVAAVSSYCLFFFFFWSTSSSSIS